MNGLVQDLRYALRQLRKSAAFTAVAVITLALGIGANTAIFSVVNGVLLRPLAFPNADRIVSMFQDKPNFAKGSISYPNFLDWQRENRTFESMAAYRWTDGSITGVGEPEAVDAHEVSATFFPILGIRPILGRNFTAQEDIRGADPVVIISEGLWKRKFGGDRNVIGQRLTVGGTPRTIVGVVPASFRMTIQNFKISDVYEPIGSETDPGFYRRDSFWGTDALGLLKPGVTLEQAREDMKAVNSVLAATYPDIDAHVKATIISLKDEMVGDMRPVLLVLLGAVGFVLLICCGNVANLLLARSTARQREFSIRLALGAAQSRIIRQLLTESVVLALAGGALGLIFAKWGTVAAIAAVPTTVPRADEIGLDFRVLLFTLATSVATGIVFGLVPALKTSGARIGETLKDTGRTIAGHNSRAQAALVIGEVAMALVLLVGAGLMLRTLVQLWEVDPGFDPHNVLSFEVTPPPSLANQPPDTIRAALRQIRSNVLSVPGVESVSLRSASSPMASDSEVNFLPEGKPQPARQVDLDNSIEFVVEPQYLQTMRIPLLRGRFFREADDEHATPVAVVDESFAKKYFPGQDPIGKHLRVLDWDTDPTQPTWMPLEVVGVVGHVKMWGLADDAVRPLQAQIYRSYMQGSNVQMKDHAQGTGIYVRFHSALASEAFFETVRKKLRAENSEIVVSRVESEEEIVARSIASQRFTLVLLGTFAGFALLLASIGIYGVLSYLVGQRTQEIGVRMALGAQRLDVLSLILADGVRMTLIGAGMGLVAAVVLTRWMASMLFGIRPTDPVTFASVAALLCGVALFACYVPARRAMRVDPMTALRYQ